MLVTYNFQIRGADMGAIMRSSDRVCVPARYSGRLNLFVINEQTKLFKKITITAEYTSGLFKQAMAHGELKLSLKERKGRW